MSSAFQTYDLTLSANKSERIAVQGNYFLILTQTGRINVRGDFGLLKGLGIGQGLKGHKFFELQVEDASGAVNSITILAGYSDSGAEFVNLQSIVASASLDAATLNTMRQPLQQTGSFNDASAIVSATPLTVFTPAANVNGAVLLTADISIYDTGGNGHAACFITKSSAPASSTDGSVLLIAKTKQYAGGTTNFQDATLAKEQYIAPGQGLYYIDDVGLAASATNRRSCRYRLL